MGYAKGEPRATARIRWADLWNPSVRVLGNASYPVFEALLNGMLLKFWAFSERVVHYYPAKIHDVRDGPLIDLMPCLHDRG